MKHGTTLIKDGKRIPAVRLPDGTIKPLIETKKPAPAKKAAGTEKE